MTEALYTDLSDFFGHYEPANLRMVPLFAEGSKALHQANIDWGLAMSTEEIEYLVTAYQKIGRDPTDAELVMFSQLIRSTVDIKFLTLTGSLMALLARNHCLR